MRFDEHFVRGALSDIFAVSGVFPQDPHFSVDTRTINKGDIFFALAGTQRDGHDFLVQAVQKGASGLCIETKKKHLLENFDKKLLEKLLVLIVPDTYYALVRFATVWRAQFDYPVVAITGSVGKTSTKELLAQVLELHGITYMASYGNQNTRIGIALNMLRMRSNHKVAIFEVGINKRGEMAKLANMLRPTTALITNIGHCHMEGLGSIGDIALEKRDIFKYFNAESIGIINGDQLLLSQVGYVHPVLKFGSKTTNQIQARKINISSTKTSFILKIYKDKYLVEVANIHAGVIFNALAVTAMAHLLKVPNETIIKAIGQPATVKGRFELCPLKAFKGSVINDCYNANPESMKAALLAFQKIDTSAKKIVVLGDMLELGLNSPFWHRQLGRFLRKIPSLKHAILVGDLVKWTKKTVPVGLSVSMAPSWKEAIVLLQEVMDQDSLVLVKGSQGIGLTNLVHEITR